MIVVPLGCSEQIALGVIDLTHHLLRYVASHPVAAPVQQISQPHPRGRGAEGPATYKENWQRNGKGKGKFRGYNGGRKGNKGGKGEWQWVLYQPAWNMW